jgi:tetratricopeptide (TPR) repeat protein
LHRAALASATILLALGCGACQRRASSKHAAPSASASTSLPPHASLVPSGLPSGSGGELARVLGRARVATEPPPKAHRVNAQGLALLRGGDPRAALARFEQAVEAAPEWLQFRYNRVCALALAGELAAAAESLAELVWLDPTNMRPRWRDDADLAPLRASPFAAALDAEAQRAGDALGRTLRDGVSVHVTGERSRTKADGSELTDCWVEPGVYLPGTRRFVATAPRQTMRAKNPYVPSLAGALTDPVSGRVLVLLGEGNNADVGNIRSIELSVFKVGEVTAGWSAALPTEEAPLVEVGLSAGGVRVRRYECNDGCDLGSFLEPGARGFAPSSDTADHGGARLLANQELVHQAQGMPAGYRLTGSSLKTPRGAIRLPGKAPGRALSRRTTLALGPGEHLAALVQWDGDLLASGMSEEADEYRVLLIDLETRAVRALSRGEDWASLAFDAQGALYLQVGEHLTRYADPRVSAPEALPAGLSL